MGNARRAISGVPARKANSARTHHSSAVYRPAGRPDRNDSACSGLASMR